MAMRIRKDGRVVCAAQYPQREGDIYLDDAHHYAIAQHIRVKECTCLSSDPRDIEWAAAYGNEAAMEAWRKKYPEITVPGSRA